MHISHWIASWSLSDKANTIVGLSVVLVLVVLSFSASSLYVEFV